MTKTYILTEIHSQTVKAKEYDDVRLIITETEQPKEKLSVIDPDDEGVEAVALNGDNISIVATKGGQTEKEPDIYAIIHRDTLKQAEQIALKEEKPFHITWYKDSMTGGVFVGERVVSPEVPRLTRYVKYLVNMSDHGFHKNFIEKIYKIKEDFIIITSYAVFIVSSKIRKRKIKRSP